MSEAVKIIQAEIKRVELKIKEYQEWLNSHELNVVNLTNDINLLGKKREELLKTLTQLKSLGG